MIEQIKMKLKDFIEKERRRRGSNWTFTNVEQLCHCAHCGKKMGIDDEVYVAYDRAFCSIECFVDGRHNANCECPLCGSIDEAANKAKKMVSVTLDYTYAFDKARKEIKEENLKKLIEEL